MFALRALILLCTLSSHLGLALDAKEDCRSSVSRTSTCPGVAASCSSSISQHCMSSAKATTKTITPRRVVVTKTVTATGTIITRNTTLVTTTTSVSTRTIQTPSTTETIVKTTTTTTTTTSTDADTVTGTTTVTSIVSATTSDPGPGPGFRKRGQPAACCTSNLSSACSCLGLTKHTVTRTLEPSTSTKTVTKRVTGTASSTANSISTVFTTTTTTVGTPTSVTSTSTEVSTDTETFSTTDSVTSTSTTTTTVTTVTIPFSEPTPTCNNFLLQVVGMEYNGSMVQYDGGGNQVLAFQQSGGVSGQFSISTSGRVTLIQLNLPVTLAASSFRNNAENVYAAAEGSDPRTGNNYAALRCDASGTYLSCETASGQLGDFSIYSQGNRLTFSPRGQPPDLFNSARLKIIPNC